MPQIIQGLQKDELWKILVDTAHSLPMYKNHKRYVEDVLLREKPEISPQEMSVQLNISLGEAIVLLDEGRTRKTAEGVGPSASKADDKTLLDFH